MSDEMFFSQDTKSLYRGKRAGRRTEVCRPCRLWLKEDPDEVYRGVVMNVNAYGMLVRMIESLPPGTDLMVQLMRDETFQQALSKPVEGMVVRNVPDEKGFTDHGIQLVQERTERKPARPLPTKRRRPARRSPSSRMHTMDITVGDLGPRRTRR